MFAKERMKMGSTRLPSILLITLVAGCLVVAFFHSGTRTRASDGHAGETRTAPPVPTGSRWEVISYDSRSDAYASPPATPRSKFPIRWSIGSVDPRLGVSTDECLGLTYLATLVWQSQIDTFLFSYQPKQPSLTVNLVYDERQELQSQINQAATARDALKLQYDRCVANHNASVTTYDQDNANAEQDRRKYEAQRLYWEARGGAPPDERARLEAWCRAGNEKVDELRRRGEALDSDQHGLQHLAEQVKRLMDDHDALLRSRTNTQTGLCRKSNDTQKVYVYCFEDKYALLVTLTHELGHALGYWEHLGDPSAIMSTSNFVGGRALSPRDLAVLSNICSEGPQTPRLDSEYLRQLNEYLRQYQMAVIRAAAGRGAPPPLPLPKETDAELVGKGDFQP